MSGGSSEEAPALLEGHIDFVPRRVCPTILFDVFHYADHSEPLRRPRVVARVVERDAFTDWLFRWPMTPGERLVDDGDAGRVGRVAFGEIAPRAQRDAHRLKVTRTAHSEDANDFLSWRRQRAAFDRQ